jgi:hypothetical protein
MSAGTYKRKIFKIAIAACAATVLSAGYALDSTRHFFFVPASPSTSGHWAIAPRIRMSVAAISTTCIPENDVPQMKIRFVSMSGLPAAQLITVR